MPRMMLLLSLQLLFGTLSAQALTILAASVNGVGIPQERLERAFEEDLRQRNIHIAQMRNPDRVKQMKRAVLDNLIEQELFWQEAQKAGMGATPGEVNAAYEATEAKFKNVAAFEQRILVEGFTPESYRALMKRRVSASKYAEHVAAQAPAVTAEEIHRFYKDNPDKFHRDAQVRVRHILIKVQNGASAAERAAKRSRIEEILKEVRDGADFEKLAREHSEAPTKQWGGEMDPFGRGQVVKPLEDAAFALAPGQVSDVLSLPESFQILKVESRSEEITISEDQAKERIHAHLQQVSGMQAVNKELERLRAVGDIKILLPL